jgi:hypothetical protein
MTRILATLSSGLLGALLGACDIPECIDGPSNLTPENTATCETPVALPEPHVVSAGAELLDDGRLILTWSSFGMECGTRATDVDISADCPRTGWTITAEIPAELVAPGTIDLAAHPEVLGSLTALHGFDGGSTGSLAGEPFLVGEIELTQISESCVSGVLRSFGSGSADPTLGGPELDGGFVAPTC